MNYLSSQYLSFKEFIEKDRLKNEATHWVMYTNKDYFDSYGCPPPRNMMSFINKGFYSEYHIQSKDSYCAAYCLFVVSLKYSWLQKCSTKFLLPKKLNSK